MKKLLIFITLFALLCGAALCEEEVEELPEFELENVEVEEKQFIFYGDSEVCSEFAESKIVLGVGETYTPTLYTDAPFWAIEFSSKNKKIASVDEDGTIHANKKGSTKIYADSIVFGPKASVKVEVKKKPTKITLPKSINIHVGETLPIKVELSSGAASHIYWQTGSKTIATVADNLVYGHRAGSTYVTGTTYNGKSALCYVNVYKWPTRIYLDDIILKRGKSMTIKPIFKPNEWDNYKVYSSNKKIVSVSKNKITAKKKGYATIYVYTTNGIETEATVYVY